MTASETYRCAQVIVATGAYRTPSIPQQLAATFPAELPQVHASEVREVETLVDTDTSLLVIGAGASGQQLTRLALKEGARVVLVGPEITNLPRRLLGKDIYWWLYHSGTMSVRTDQPPGRWLADDRRGTVTVDEDPKSLHALPAVHRVVDHVTAYVDGCLHFRTTPPLPWPGDKKGVVLYCTGYRNRYPFLPTKAVDGNGAPRERGGVSTSVPGLYYLGLPNLRHLDSSLVGGVGRDAEQIVAKLAARR